MALILTAGAVAAWANVDELRYLTGQVQTVYPYPTRLHPGAATTSRTLPRGARLVIPRLGVDVPIGEKDLEAALRVGVWRHAGSARPNESGNTVVAGHRRRAVFSLLYRLRRGDEVIVYWRGKEYDYKVISKREVGPTYREALRRTGPTRLTMYTCLPRYLGNKRTVVVAYPVRR
jgi:LPXTG-site transpeptidase (sortase) family protein